MIKFREVIVVKELKRSDGWSWRFACGDVSFCIDLLNVIIRFFETCKDSAGRSLFFNTGFKGHFLLVEKISFMRLLCSLRPRECNSSRQRFSCGWNATALSQSRTSYLKTSGHSREIQYFHGKIQIFVIHIVIHLNTNSDTHMYRTMCMNPVVQGVSFNKTDDSLTRLRGTWN